MSNAYKDEVIKDGVKIIDGESREKIVKDEFNQSERKKIGEIKDEEEIVKEMNKIILKKKTKQKIARKIMSMI